MRGAGLRKFAFLSGGSLVRITMTEPRRRESVSIQICKSSSEEAGWMPHRKSSKRSLLHLVDLEQNYKACVKDISYATYHFIRRLPTQIRFMTGYILKAYT